MRALAAHLEEGSWPVRRIHVCALDRHCWKMWWQIAAPMRIHIGEHYWNIPVLTAIANRRSSRMWKDVR